MDESGEGTVHHYSEHGTTASHPKPRTPELRLAPSTDTSRNTVSWDLIPAACLSLPDCLFEFDSSFVNPEIADRLKGLPTLREMHKSPEGNLPLLSIFGHADPVGPDEYNKQLSGRRAK